VTEAPLSVLVVDDEPLARRRLRRLLEREAVAIAGECGNGREAVDALQKGGVDAVFLDVQMPGLDGFDVLEAVGAARMPPVVFVTAFDQYAVRAFDVHAVDYLLKPFDAERFRRALSRLRQARSAPRDELSERLRRLLQDREAERRPPRFLVRHAHGMRLVTAQDVEWIEAQGNYAALHAGPDTHLLREPLSSLEARLDGEQFLRVSRSAVVNVSRVKALSPWTKDEHVLVLASGTRIAVSRGYRERVERVLSG